MTRRSVILASALLVLVACQDNPTSSPSADGGDSSTVQDAQDTPPDTTPSEPLDRSQIEAALKGATRAPDPYLVMGAVDQIPVVPIPSPAQTRDALAGGEYPELAQALTTAGYSIDEAATLVYGAAGYGSGQPHDYVKARSQAMYVEMSSALEDFEAEIVALEAQGVAVDRDALNEAADLQLVRPNVPGQ